MYLVGQEQAGHRLSVGQCELAVQVLFPFLAVAEGSGIGNIKHNNTGGGIPVVQSCHGCEALLSWEEREILQQGILGTSPKAPSNTLPFLPSLWERRQCAWCLSPDAVPTFSNLNPCSVIYYSCDFGQVELSMANFFPSVKWGQKK